jgi:DNA glycosylase AlkZ-like
MPSPSSSPAGAPVLGTRALNRALLARQLLLDRTSLGAADAVAHLVGLQAQTPRSPYIGLWSRLTGFDPHELGRMLVEREVVRIALMRSTIHLVTADDCRFLRPLLERMLARRFAQSGWTTGVTGVDLDAVAAAGRRLVDEEPLTLAELGARLAGEFPGREPQALAQVVRSYVPLVQVPPRAVWGRSGAATHTSAEAWLGRPLDGEGNRQELILRYLAAFGPASVMDVQAWSGLTRLADVADRLGDRVRRFRTDEGRELLDLPDAPRPDPDTPAPVRFLPDYDNVLLSHADRTRVVDDDIRRSLRSPNGVIPGTVLVDGRVAAQWSVEWSGGEAVLAVAPLVPLAPADRDGVAAEGADLLAFLAPEAEERGVRIANG